MLFGLKTFLVRLYKGPLKESIIIERVGTIAVRRYDRKSWYE